MASAEDGDVGQALEMDYLSENNVATYSEARSSHSGSLNQEHAQSRQCRQRFRAARTLAREADTHDDSRISRRGDDDRRTKFGHSAQTACITVAVLVIVVVLVMLILYWQGLRMQVGWQTELDERKEKEITDQTALKVKFESCRNSSLETKQECDEAKEELKRAEKEAMEETKDRAVCAAELKHCQEHYKASAEKVSTLSEHLFMMQRKFERCDNQGLLPKLFFQGKTSQQEVSSYLTKEI